MDSKLRCPGCNSSQTRARIKSNDRICYTCGNIYPAPKESLDTKKEVENSK